jgi:subtilase family serine protease
MLYVTDWFLNPKTKVNRSLLINFPMVNQEQLESFDRSQPQAAVVEHLNFSQIQSDFSSTASEVNERIRQLEKSQIVSPSLLDLVVSL